MKCQIEYESCYVGTYILISDFSDDMHVISRVANEPALDEGNVQDGGVKIDELENEDFERQIVVEFGLGAMHFWKMIKLLT